MDSSDVTQLIILLILLGLSAFFSSAETALTTVNKIRIRSLAEDGNKRAKTVLKITDDSGKMLSAILIGNNIVNLSAASLTTSLAYSFGGSMVAIASGILTVLILLFGEITPKTMATIHAEKMALIYAPIISIFMKVMTPVIFIINGLSIGVLFLLRVDPNAKNDLMTETELRTIVDVSHEDGVIESDEREMIYNVFDLGDAKAKDVMVPRIDMVFVDIEADYDDLIQIFREEHYTRLPVYKETTDNVVGIINIKDLLLVEDKASFCVSDYLRQPFYTFESKKLSELMMEIKKSPNNIIIVLDEYGATAGLITLEDILEEIVGDIRDEYDEDEEEELVDLGDGQYLVEGSMKLDDLNDILDLELSSEDYDSVGGLVIDRLEHLPSQGEEVVCGNVRLVVEQVEKNRIDKVHLYILPGEKEEE